MNVLGTLINILDVWYYSVENLIAYNIAFFSGSLVIAICALYMLGFAKLLHSKGQMLMGLGFFLLAISYAVAGNNISAASSIISWNIYDIISFIIIFWGCQYFLNEIHGFKRSTMMDRFILYGGLLIMALLFLAPLYTKSFYVSAIPSRIFLFIGDYYLFKTIWNTTNSTEGKIAAIGFLAEGIHVLDYFIFMNIDFLSGGGILLAILFSVMQTVGISLHLLRFKTRNNRALQGEHLEGLPILNGDKKKLLLTDRQMEILHLIATGSMNKEIAHALDISEPTVSFHLKNMKKKLGARSNRDIIAKAISFGIILPSLGQ